MPEAEVNQTVETTANTATETVAPEQEKYDETRAMALIQKLRAENRELSKTAKKAAELETAETKRKEAEMTELQKATKRAEEAEAKAKALEAKQTRLEVAQKVGLPAVFANRLQGETPEELEADAKAIMEALPKTTKTTPQPNATNPAGASGEKTQDQKDADTRAWLNFGNSAPFQGGGVFMTDK